MTSNYSIRIKELREEKGILQKELAQILKVRNTTVSAWETGTNEPDIKTIIALAEYFDVCTDYLLGRQDWR